LAQKTQSYRRALGGRHTSFGVVYEKTDDNQLIANFFSAPKLPEEKRKVTFPQFLALAWTAANAKAREIGWIALGPRGIWASAMASVASSKPRGQPLQFPAALQLRSARPHLNAANRS
jgi:hypothetical protein